MKLKINNVFLIFLVISSISIFAIESTSDVAQKMKFYDYLKNLRNKVTKNLEDLEDKISSQIQSLRNQGKFRKATIKEEKLKNMFIYYLDKFDTALSEIDKEFVLNGDKLDDVNAPIKEKEKLITNLKNKSEQIINKMIQEAKKEFKL